MTTRPYIKRQMFRLKCDGESLEHCYRDLNRHMKILDFYEDFDREFPWLSVYGFGGQDGVGFHEIWMQYRGYDDEGNRKLCFMTAGSPYNMPEEVMYTMLKLKGVDVSKYGFTEEWDNEE
jgi:hypothetical protein